MKRSVCIIAFLIMNSVFAFGADHIKANKEISKLGTEKVTSYTAQDFSRLLGMKGFNDNMLQMHFVLYRGYVKNTNDLLKTIKGLAEDGKAKSYEFGALKRRLGWEFDGMRLHEYYFSNLGGDGVLDQNSPLFKEISSQFGSIDEWKKDFVATGIIRGIGWVILYEDEASGKLMNVWINEHDLGHLAGGKILLVMDVWEHAYMPQYGLNRAKYIQAFLNNIDWKRVNSRYKEGINGKKTK